MLSAVTALGNTEANCRAAVSIRVFAKGFSTESVAGANPDLPGAAGRLESGTLEDSARDWILNSRDLVDHRRKFDLFRRRSGKAPRHFTTSLDSSYFCAASWWT